MVGLFWCVGLEINNFLSASWIVPVAPPRIRSFWVGQSFIQSHPWKHFSAISWIHACSLEVTRSLLWSSGCCHSELICVNKWVNLHSLKIWIVSEFLPLRLFLPQSINGFIFHHTALMARESTGWGSTVQKCLIMAAFQIKWRRCIIHLWRIPCEWGPAGKQEVFLSASHLTIG